jgi:hypothetical protein
MKVIGTVFVRKNCVGDFEWMIESGDYENALFIFNEDEWRQKWKKAGLGNAVIRKYNKYAVLKPRSVGVLTGTKFGGYEELNYEIKGAIDECMEDIIYTIKKYNYDTIYYSSEIPNGLLGTSIFNVNKDVLEYITTQLHGLQKLK